MPQLADRNTPARLADLLVDSFAEDPFFRWMYPGQDYAERAREYFGLVCERLWPRAVTHVSENGLAASLWIPPGRPIAEPDAVVALALLLQRQLGERARDALRAIGSTSAYVPPDDHATCVYVAVRADQRGRGLGVRVMKPALDEYGRGGSGVFLTSTNPRNATFYERLGFATLADLPVDPPDGPVLRPMWRPASRETA